jgi:hypothetical protein
MAAALVFLWTAFWVLWVVVCFQTFPLGAALGTGVYAAVLLARWCRWRRSA